MALSNANGQCSTFSGSGYSGNGDVVSAKDSVNGNWSYTYDDFNRLVSARCKFWANERNLDELDPMTVSGTAGLQAQTVSPDAPWSYTGHNNWGWSYLRSSRR